MPTFSVPYSTETMRCTDTDVEMTDAVSHQNWFRTGGLEYRARMCVSTGKMRTCGAEMLKKSQKQPLPLQAHGPQLIHQCLGSQSTRHTLKSPKIVWRVDCRVLRRCDELTVWRLDHVTRWPCIFNVFAAKTEDSKLPLYLYVTMVAA